MTADGPVVSQLMRYLDEADRHGRRWAIDPAPLRQDVAVERGQREPLVPRLDGEVRNGVSSALARIRSAGERIDRRLLMAASERAGADGAERVACWFLVMVWGAGPTENFRLRQWTKALGSPRLLPALADSQAAIADNRLAEGYRAAKLPGLDESYFTNWLWAAGLAVPDLPVRPAVLDTRVWAALRLLRWSPTGKNRADRWVDYCAALGRWAEQLHEARPHWTLDGDRLEQILFDRRRKPGTPFVDWLANDHDLPDMS